MESIHFNPVSTEGFISVRQGETRLGEKVLQYRSEAVSGQSPKFVLLGIQEDAGIRRNGGIGNLLGVYDQFLKSFLNVQNNEFLSGDLFLIDGCFTIENETENCIDELDAAVSERIFRILSHGYIPIVIGGGHNNAYGLLKGLSLYRNAPANVINLDAHADLRTTETRHSGNGFSKAAEDKYLEKYALLGLHEPYNNTHILKLIAANPDFKAIFFEDIVLRNKTDFETALNDSLDHVSGSAFGVEWDVDSLENMISSAMTPVGWNTHQVMRFLYASGRRESLYLHISESVFERADGLRNPLLGKLLSYAVQAFVKGKIENI